MTTTIDVENLSVTAPSGRHAWWPWAVLGLGAAVVIVGGVFFTPTADSPSPHDAGSGQSSAN
jgi:hypothetical protein